MKSAAVSAVPESVKLTLMAPAREAVPLRAKRKVCGVGLAASLALPLEVTLMMGWSSSVMAALRVRAARPE